jgi:hypothetical protein
LKLKVSLYTGFTEPRTAEVFLHLTYLLWFIRDTLTNTPEGQHTLLVWERQTGAQCPPMGALARRVRAQPWCQVSITLSAAEAEEVTRRNGLISVMAYGRGNSWLLPFPSS